MARSPSSIPDSAAQQLALSLLNADSEDDAVRILRDAGYWDDPDVWRLYGDRDGNFATIGNQQSRPEAALVEKIVNCVDARLLGACLRMGIDPESPNAPQSIREAIVQLIEDRSRSTSTGGLENWTRSFQLEQARMISLAITGNKPRQGMPCITIADAGEGQTPARFPDTFLSIDRSNKLRIPFVQGKFNMGSTGALKFCGKLGLQLIISRRNPDIIERWSGSTSKWRTDDPRSSQWSFTIIRRVRPTGEAGNVRNSVFKYLAPLTIEGDDNKQVLSFSADAIPILPEGNRAYSRTATSGSVIKLYEYDTKGFGSQALMKGGLLSRLEALLPSIALPVRVHECRDYRGDEARSFENTLVGLSVRLGENRGDNLEPDYPTSSSFVVRQQRMTAQIFAFKDDRAESYRTNEGVIFTINGQTHGHIPKTFFERARVKMGRLAKSLLIIVDCTDISVDAREDLFMNSRDRLSAGELRKEIEEELENIIRNHPGLRELQARRRAAEIQNRLQESRPLEQVIDSILRSSPSLSRLFRFGQRLSRPHRADATSGEGGSAQGENSGRADFHPRPNPTYFRFHRKRDGEQLLRNAEIDRRCRIRFETDASNDFFERERQPGRYELEVLDGPLDGSELTHSCTIHNGIANWSIKLPDDRVAVGDRITVQCLVFDDARLEPFTNVATIVLTPHGQNTGGGGSGRNTNTSGGRTGDGEGSGNGRNGSSNAQGSSNEGGLTLPPMYQVHRNDSNWNTYGFDDRTACRVFEDDDGSYSFYINVDNIFLQTDMRDGTEDVALRRTKFVWGNVLVGLALIHEDKQSHQGNDGDEHGEDNEDAAQTNVFARIDRTTRALSPFLIPMIDYLGSITEEDIIQVAQRGDDE